MTTSVHIALIGPTSAPWDSLRHDIEADLGRFARPGIRLSYRLTGRGPASIRTAADAAAAAPHVRRAAVQAARDGVHGLVVDCTDDPGVSEAQRLVDIPVIGAGQALRTVLAQAPRPIVLLTGDELRSLRDHEIIEIARTTPALALGATGFSHLSDIVAVHAPGARVIDPLREAITICHRRINATLA